MNSMIIELIAALLIAYPDLTPQQIQRITHISEPLINQEYVTQEEIERWTTQCDQIRSEP